MTRHCPHNKEDAVEVKNLTVKYDNFMAIENIDLEIKRGCFVSIIGPNGSGKTTLLKAMIGLIKPSSGEVLIFGKKVSKQKDLIGYVPQRFSFDKTFPITVWEFLRFSLRVGEPLSQIDEKLKEMDLLDKKKKVLGELSGGQMQRVLVARAILNDPKVLFLDEPASGIDVGAEKNFYELMDYLNQKYGITIIMVSHELDVVTKYTHRVICLNKKMICHGDPSTVLDAEMVKKLYGEHTTVHKH